MNLRKAGWVGETAEQVEAPNPLRKTHKVVKVRIAKKELSYLPGEEAVCSGET